jgi:hypothetical protein
MSNAPSSAPYPWHAQRGMRQAVPGPAAYSGGILGNEGYPFPTLYTHDVHAGRSPICPPPTAYGDVPGRGPIAKAIDPYGECLAITGECMRQAASYGALGHGDRALRDHYGNTLNTFAQIRSRVCPRLADPPGNLTGDFPWCTSSRARTIQRTEAVLKEATTALYLPISEIE